MDAFTISGGKYYFSIENGTSVTVEDGTPDLTTNRSIIVESDPNASRGSRASVYMIQTTIPRQAILKQMPQVSTRMETYCYPLALTSLWGAFR